MSEQPGHPGTPVVGILGATGHIGRRVATLLQSEAAPHVLFARDAAAEVPRGDGTLDVRATDYADPASLRAAFEGIDTLLFVSAREAPQRLSLHRNVVEAASAAGVRHLVYTSFLGASPRATFTFARDHFATEKLLQEAAEADGPAFTALRDAFYLEALLSFVGRDGVIRGPADDGRVAAVSREDVAAVAASILREPAPYAGRILDVTGREALSLSEAAALIEEETGRPTVYRCESIPEAYASRASYGAERWEVDAWVSTYTAIAAGELSDVSDTVKRVTGREPLTLRDVLRR